MGWSVKFACLGARFRTEVRAALIALRKARQSMPLTNSWLKRLRKGGTRAGGRKGEAKAAVGVIGISPAPIALILRRSATERPTKAGGPEATRGAAPSEAAGGGG